MTRKQSFALFCKSGVDVRNAALTRCDIDKAFSLPFSECRAFLAAFPGARATKQEKRPRGEWQNREYELLWNHANEEAAKVYAEHAQGGKHGAAVIIMSCKRNFARWCKSMFSYRGTGVKFVLDLGGDMAGNAAAAERFCAIVLRAGFDAAYVAMSRGIIDPKLYTVRG